MKHRLLIVIVLIINCTAVAQDSKYSLETNFPILIGNSFIKENYSGIFDLGFKARLKKTNMLNIGFQLNTGLYNYKENSREAHFKNLYVFQPKLYIESNFKNKLQ